MSRCLTLAALWLVATALAGGVTWAAVAWSEREPVAGVDPQRPLTPAEVRGSLAELGTLQPAAPGAGARSATTPRKERPRPVRPRPSLQTRSWQVAGGSVAAGCRAHHIELLYAAPANGWAYRLDQASTTGLTVRFTHTRALSTLRAQCAGGIPVEISATSSSQPPAESESGD